MNHIVQVFDPAMCCSTGVCGPSVDPELVRVSRDLAWLKHQPGIQVERFNLAQEPQAFAASEVVRAELQKNPEVLPLVLLDGEVVARGGYPTREELCAMLGLELPQAPTGLTVVNP